MTVQHEIKSQLAKLLATEDIIVEHKKVETAEFNVQTRVLTLPMWEKASNGVIDMLVGHEVGHALSIHQIQSGGKRFRYLNSLLMLLKMLVLKS